MVILEEDGVTDTVGVVGVGAVPVPVNATFKGLPGALLDIVKVPVLGPTVEGEKVMLMVQVPFGARLDVQLLLWPKPLETDKLSPCKAVPPVLPSVTMKGELVVRMSWLPN